MRLVGKLIAVFTAQKMKKSLKRNIIFCAVTELKNWCKNGRGDMKETTANFFNYFFISSLKTGFKSIQYYKSILNQILIKTMTNNNNNNKIIP